MLEDMAEIILKNTYFIPHITYYGIIVISGLLIVLIKPRARLLSRRLFFLYYTLILLASIAPPMFWLGIVINRNGGFHGSFIDINTLFMLGFFCNFLVGCGLGIIALARSQDAYGHGRMAFLAFIPIANLWLLFAPSQKPTAERAAIPQLEGGVRAIIYFVVLFECCVWFGHLAVDTFDFLEKVEQRVAVLRERAADMQAILDEKGLEGTLQMIAENATLGVIDENRTLIRAERHGTTFSIWGEINKDGEASVPSLKARLLRGFCNQFEPLGFLIQAGATVNVIFVSVDDVELLNITANWSDCDV